MGELGMNEEGGCGGAREGKRRGVADFDPDLSAAPSTRRHETAKFCDP